MNLRNRGYIEMKRLVFCIIALSIVFVFTACGGTRDGAEGGTPDTSAVLDASADISDEVTDPETEPVEAAGESGATTAGTDSEPSTADSVSSAPTEDTVPATDAPVTLPSVTTPSPVTSPITAPPTTNPPVTAPPVTEPPHVTEPCRHVNTEVRNKRAATVSETGYTGDVYCLNCGYMLSCGWETPRIQQIDPANHEFYDIEMEIFRLINEERARNGVAPLVWDESLYAGTKIRAQEATTNYSHTRPDGSAPSTAFDGFYGAMGENLTRHLIVYDHAAKTMVEGWIQSPGHHQNMIDSKFGRTAIAIVKYNDEYVAANIFTN